MTQNFLEYKHCACGSCDLSEEPDFSVLSSNIRLAKCTYTKTRLAKIIPTKTTSLDSFHLQQLSEAQQMKDICPVSLETLCSTTSTLCTEVHRSKVLYLMYTCTPAQGHVSAQGLIYDPENTVAYFLRKRRNWCVCIILINNSPFKAAVCIL